MHEFLETSRIVFIGGLLIVASLWVLWAASGVRFGRDHGRQESSHDQKGGSG